tara:strand:- start:1055 stop:1330 length:276 start_codon:yes stop_codon:yes gene_type:complete
MIRKIDSVFSLYPTAVTVSGTDDSFTAVDKDGNSISINMDNVNADYTSKEYKNKREREYPPVVDQLDDIYHNGIDAWKATIKATKEKYPKP